MIKQSLRKGAYAVAPRFVVDRYLHYRMVRQARQLSRLRDSSADLSVLMDTLWRSHFFRPLQKKSEILRLIEIVRSFRPSAICEIGAAGCGTTFLLAEAAASDATIITLDLAFTESRKTAIRCFARKKQRMVALQEDSHNLNTIQIVRDYLAEQSLDMLYLDGDHSYEGIKSDFRFYSPLVRPGGLIVFHDIVPDFKTRYGIETSSDVGGVPQFWEEIKASYNKAEEIIEDIEQDGFGIGILHVSDANEYKPES